jgi:hypothetical protein
MKSDNKMLLEMIKQAVEESHQQAEAAEFGREHMQDHEGKMAKGELRDMIKNGLIIYKSFDKNDELPGWISAYITLASDYMHSVMEYMVEQNNSDQIEEPQDFDDEEAQESEESFDT